MRKHTISFKNAMNGVLIAARTQSNLRIHLAIATVVFLLGAILKISLTEALVLLLTVALVVAAEMGNTAIEFLSDAVTQEQNECIGCAKDVAAGAVLISAIFAAIIGFTIFMPKLINLL